MDAMKNPYGVAFESVPSREAGRGAGMGRAAPQSVQDLGLPVLFLGQLALKHCFYMDFFTLGDLAERLKVSASIISEVLDYLKKNRWVEVRGPDPMHPVANALSLVNRHSLTEAGRRQAAQLLEYDAYAGPAPVVLNDYWQQVTRQSIGAAAITPDHVKRALKGLVLSAEILEQVGVAAVSGKPLFLYGPAETAKPSSPST